MEYTPRHLDTQADNGNSGVGVLKLPQLPGMSSLTFTHISGYRYKYKVSEKALYLLNPGITSLLPFNNSHEIGEHLSDRFELSDAVLSVPLQVSEALTTCVDYLTNHSVRTVHLDSITANLNLTGECDCGHGTHKNYYTTGLTVDSVGKIVTVALSMSHKSPWTKDVLNQMSKWCRTHGYTLKEV